MHSRYWLNRESLHSARVLKKVKQEAGAPNPILFFLTLSAEKWRPGTSGEQVSMVWQFSPK